MGHSRSRNITLDDNLSKRKTERLNSLGVAYAPMTMPAQGPCSCDYMSTVCCFANVGNGNAGLIVDYFDKIEIIAADFTGRDIDPGNVISVDNRIVFRQEG